MPLISSSYVPPAWLPGAHLQTIYPALFRNPLALNPQRFEFTLPDDDFIEVDYMRASAQPSSQAVLLLHGMEGHSRKAYITHMAHIFLHAGWDCYARNCRGCGQKLNNSPRLYNSGQTDDIHALLTNLLALRYKLIVLIGFSMGGNQLLKYLGEYNHVVPSGVKAAVAFSAPCDLAGCSKELEKTQNMLYMHNFLHTLREKVRKKHKQYPQLYPLNNLNRIHTFSQFDEQYTAPIHGYSSALDYWKKASSLSFLPGISIPTLLVSAHNDPFLSPSCYPRILAAKHPSLFLEIPEEGGHVGFSGTQKNSPYWSEQRALAFIKENALQ